MVFDELTIIASGIIILLAIISPLINPFFRWRGKKEDNTDKDDAEATTSATTPLPPISVIVTIHNDSDELDKHLALLLTQDYPADYQVVIVAEKGDTNAENIINKYHNNEHLYATFIPDSSRYMSRKKLAITIGVKAAKYEWVVITEPFSSPVSDEWLESMARNFNDTNNIVMGYSGYDQETKSYYRFERLRTSCYLMNEALHGTAYRTNGTNTAFRKSEFMHENGYQGNLNLIRGEYDFLVNKYARKGCTAVETSPKAWIRDDAPTKKAWHNKHIFYQQTRKQLQRCFAHRALYDFDMSMMILNYLFIIAALSYSILFQRWILTIAAGLALIITMSLRIWFAKKVIRQFDEHIPLWKIVPFEIGILWSSFANIIRYKLANKYDFTSHKI